MMALAILLGFASGSLFGTSGVKMRSAIKIISDFLEHILNLISGLLPFILFFAVLSTGLYAFIDFDGTVLYVESIFLSIVTFFPAALLLLLVYGLFLLCNGISPIRFFRDYRTILLTNFRIGSNIQALPYNKRILSRRVKLPNETLTDVLNIGASVNMGGYCLVITHGLPYVFISGYIFVSVSEFLAIALIILLLSIGIPNQPCSFTTAMTILFPVLGLPTTMYESILITEIFLGRFYSFLNSLGDLVIVAIYDYKFQKKIK